MKRKMKTLCGFLSLFLVIITTVCSFNVPVSEVDAALIQKKTYEIAVVYDNSGSMYYENKNNDNILEKSKAWCRAKYAMEIFASMLNYQNGDKLVIHPMWEVTTDGSKPTDYNKGSYGAIEIDSKEDIDKINKLYTIQAADTPLETIQEAYDRIKKSNATDKWIIVLTDGKFNLEKRTYKPTDKDYIEGGKKGANLEKILLGYCDDDINVQYLGFGKAANLTSNPSKNFYAKLTTDDSLQDDLIDICNSIFQRSVLPETSLKGSTLKLDLSMKNLIVFVQGKDAKITSLKDPSGKNVSPTLNSGQRTYSDISAGNYTETAEVDTSLSGQVVTFPACAKGTYTLDYRADSDKIQIFYEPDVKVEATLKDKDGNTVDLSKGTAMLGDYTVESKLVDVSTGEDVTNHELLGKNVKFTTYVKTSKDSSYKSYPDGTKITLGKDSKTDIYVEAIYLDKYKIDTKGDAGFFPLDGVEFESPVSNFAIRAEVTQPDGMYALNNPDDWKPVKVTATIDGAPATKEQLASIKLAIKPSKSLTYYQEVASDGSGINVYIGKNKDGAYVAPEAGTYKLDFSGTTYTDQYKETYGYNQGSTDSVSFDVAPLPVFKIEADVLQSQNWYVLKDHKEWKPIKVKVSIDGADATKEQLESVKLSLKSSKDITYHYELAPDESAIYVYIGSGEDGAYVEPETGKYTFEFKGTTYTDEYDKTYGYSEDSTDEVKFEIQTYSKFWRWLKWILIILVIILLIIFFMTRKVMPKKMVKDRVEYWCLSAGDQGDLGSDVTYNAKRRYLTISGLKSVDADELCNATFSLKPADRRYVLPSKRRRVTLVGINSNCEKIRVGGTEYVQCNGGYVKANLLKKAEQSGTNPEIDQTMSCSPRIELIRAPGGADTAKLVCSIKTVK